MKNTLRGLSTAQGIFVFAALLRAGRRLLRPYWRLVPSRPEIPTRISTGMAIYIRPLTASPMSNRGMNRRVTSTLPMPQANLTENASSLQKMTAIMMEKMKFSILFSSF